MPAAKNEHRAAAPDRGPSWLRRLLAWVSKGAAQAPLCPG
jgi:hypothetical protein